MDGLDLDLEKAGTQAGEEFTGHVPIHAASSNSDDETFASDEAVHRPTLSQHPTHTTEHSNLHHSHTVGALFSHTETVKTLPEFGGGKPYPPSIPADREAYVVDFTGPDDPLHPFNWTLGQK